MKLYPIIWDAIKKRSPKDSFMTIDYIFCEFLKVTRIRVGFGWFFAIAMIKCNVMQTSLLIDSWLHSECVCTCIIRNLFFLLTYRLCVNVSKHEKWSFEGPVKQMPCPVY